MLAYDPRRSDERLSSVSRLASMPVFPLTRLPVRQNSPFLPAVTAYSRRGDQAKLPWVTFEIGDGIPANGHPFLGSNRARHRVTVQMCAAEAPTVRPTNTRTKRHVKNCQRLEQAKF